MNRLELERKWDKITSIPLLLLSLVFLVAYAWPIIDPEMSPDWVTTCDAVQNIIWAIFIVDFVGRFVVAPKKWPFIKRNFVELIAIALPFLRPLRALRLLSVTAIGVRRFGAKLQNRVTFYVLSTAGMLWFITGLAITEAERGAEGANIANVWQGWWWSFITLATVGYGDKYPVTAEGQWVAVIIVLTGIALIGTVSAILAAWFVESVKSTETEILADAEVTKSEIGALIDEVRSLRVENENLRKDVSKFLREKR